jgi:exodeoxyribonuclease V gamma subunit
VLYIHRSERADQLVEALGDVLAEPLADPLVPEVVAVPTRGVERWLAQRLSHRLGASCGRADGVCGNVVFPFPGALVGRAMARGTGIDAEEDPWPPERSVWPLLEVVDDHFHDPFLAPLAEHLRAAWPVSDTTRTRRFATVRHLADLFDRYGVHRPEMVQAWARGDARTDDLVASGVSWSWQAELWRCLRDRIGVQSPAERLPIGTARIKESPALLDLPMRMSVFGLTRLPNSHLTVLQAIATSRDVHLFLLHPSAALWAKVALSEPEPPRRLLRTDDNCARLPANPLLRSWGRDAREMQLVLAAHGATDAEHRPIVGEPRTLLGRIQADIRADRPPPPAVRPGEPDLRPILDDGDDSLRVHSCHGRYRQVEVMRDAILHLLAADTSLEPRHVIVMCPDIEHYAPLLHAVFGAGASAATDSSEAKHRGDDATAVPELRVRLADRSIRQTNPLLGVADLLLELAASRLTASQVLDLVSRPPVRHRFHFDDDDLTQLEQWVVETGVRWGLDGEHRAQWGLPTFTANSWLGGLDRLLLGVAMAEEDERLFGGILPLDDVASGMVDLAGRFAELIDRLASAMDRLRGPHSLGDWRHAIASATEALAAVGGADAWQHDQLHGILDDLVGEASSGLPPSRAGPASPLDLTEVRSALGERLQGQPTRANFRTGDLTICTLVPMRSVPHRVVGLLGLDDGMFPRNTQRDGDDLLLQAPCVGDRDARSEDRQLLLDALLAATDHVIITFNGRDERTNHERPPAVPIAELLDVVDGTVRVANGSNGRDRVVIRHPLQSFDPRNFVPAALGAPGPWSFDPLNLAGALAWTGDRDDATPFLVAPLAGRVEEVVRLDALVRFVEHPMRGFLRERLGFYATDPSDEVDDQLPIELDGLEKWEVGDRLLRARLAGSSAEGAIAAELARGSLPMGRLADGILDEVGPSVEALVAEVAALACADLPAESREVNLRLPDGRAVIGTVPGVQGATIVRCVYSTLAPKHRLAAWVRFLALSAAWPELDVSAVTIGRTRRDRDRRPHVRTCILYPLAADAEQRRSHACAALAALVDLYDRGMCEPLPLACETSAAWASARRTGEDPYEAARAEWTSERGFSREDGDAEHRLVLGGVQPLARLLVASPRPDETGAGWASGESTRFGALARRLWDGLLDHERDQ